MLERTADNELVRRMAAGDTAAFRHLVDLHMPKAHAVAYRVLLNREDAEDAVQAAFTKVWTHAKRFDPAKSAFSTWLYTIVTRTCLDRLRRAKPLSQPIDDWSERLSDDAPDAQTGLETRQQAQKVRDAVATLPPNQRMAVVLCYFEGFSNAEAAQSLKLNVKALESLLVRARKSLKNVLGSPHG
ncbi:sigma-70 family RNA polymerase sigma factor [Asticcacaulis sp. BYS171W]|uniref:Sigma-70 family RNA polymerase sigma factor n=1 Tax=Asticcacaulis aquaticus TaxID=2984212 RepID=A0ABT5HSL9_9CAUL|nr:sigma-70 family RNA polymerase sigma factor [Asticcacaulis aquaticus]MDC7682461.1 sigma-70 family RNA polymerase sigma factor [Asticcacaulis aquaticus]